MRKIPARLENPIDNLIYIVVEYTAPIFHSIGMTPNHLTTVSNLFGIASAYLIVKHNFEIAAVLFMIAYIFDCLDGYVARKYDMVTKFGDVYDHASDIFKIVITFLAIAYENLNTLMWFTPVYAIGFLLQMVHFGCQENHYGKPESDWLYYLRSLCVSKNKPDLENKMRFTRFFGSGTIYTIIAINIIALGPVFQQLLRVYRKPFSV
jgi:phosphatidylglycerophosphate synthase